MGHGKSKEVVPGGGNDATGVPPPFQTQETLYYSPDGGLASKQGGKKKKGAKDEEFQLIPTNTLGVPLKTFFARYDLSNEILGRGSFAEVRLARAKNSGDLVAVKIMQKREMDDRDLEDVRREVEILKHLNHENIVKVYEYYEDNNFVYVVMEYLSGGELYKNVAELVDFTENDTRDIMLTLIHALHYCKERGIAHRDIKPENILLRKKIIKKKSSNSDDGAEVDDDGFTVPKLSRETSFREARRKYEIALADFGFAIQKGREDFTGAAMETQCGTPLFIAPEILQKKRYNYKCDVWSLGVVCFMLLSGGNLPFPARSLEELYGKVQKGKWDFVPEESWKGISENAKKFVRRLLVNNPDKRATYDELLDHVWFKDNSKATTAPNVNFSPMKKFNARRKVLKIMKARQAAIKFKALMEDLEQNDASDANLKLYKEAIDLTAFYKNPTLKTDAETRGDKARIEEVPIPQAGFNSVMFKNIDDDI